MADKTWDKLSNGVLHMVSKNAEMFEPLRSNNFELYIPSLIHVDYVSGPNAGTAIKSRDFVLSVKSVTPPSATINTLEIAYGNAKAKYAGMSEFNTSEIVFNDFLGIDVARALEAWYNKVFNLNTHQIGRKKDYAMLAYLIEYSPDGMLQRVWELHNCWINSFQLGSYDNDDPSIRQVTCSFVYDWFNESTRDSFTWSMNASV